MRKLLVLSVFALSLAVFAPLSPANSTDRPYFGFNLGYAYQELQLKGSSLRTDSGDIITNIKEDGIFIAPRAGIFLGIKSLALEFEPRWTFSSYNVQTEPGTRGAATTNRYVDPDGALHHALLPLLVVAKARSGNGGASIGLGSGLHFYDISDEVHQHASVPVIFKLDFWYLTSENIKVGMDAQLGLRVWSSESNVDNLIQAGLGFKVGFN